MKLKHTISAAVTALLLWAPIARATTIAAVVTPQDIVIAADSLVTKESAKGMEGTGYAQKIETFGDTVVAAGGLAKTGDNLFDVFRLVGEACHTTFGADAQSQVFAGLMRRKLPAVVSGIRRQSNGAGFPDRVTSTVWFCGVESSRPVIYEVVSEIGLGMELQPTVKINRFPPYAFPQGSGVLFIGPNSLGAKPFQLNPLRLRDVNYLVGAADQIVRSGISDPRGRSGGAVTIFHISRDGARMLSRS